MAVAKRILGLPIMAKESLVSRKWHQLCLQNVLLSSQQVELYTANSLDEILEIILAGTHAERLKFKCSSL